MLQLGPFDYMRRAAEALLSGAALALQVEDADVCKTIAPHRNKHE